MLIVSRCGVKYETEIFQIFKLLLLMMQTCVCGENEVQQEIGRDL